MLVSRVAYDPIRHLSSALFSYDQRERLMAFVTAYFDESYASQNPLVYTVAGYISTDRRWVKFQKEWLGLLNHEVRKRWCEVYGPEKKLFFHMTDFDNPYSKIYGDWPQKKRTWFLKELHKVIKKAYIKSFSSGLVVADYNELTDEEKYAMGSPHILVAVNCAKMVAEWANEENRQHPILYVFEKGNRYDAALGRLFNGLNPEMKAFYRMTEDDGFAVKNKRDMPPLQAADVLARETRKEVERRLQEPLNRRKMRESLKNLHLPMLDHWGYINAVEMRKIFNHSSLREQMESETYKQIVREARWKPKI